MIEHIDDSRILFETEGFFNTNYNSSLVFLFVE